MSRSYRWTSSNLVLFWLRWFFNLFYGTPCRFPPPQKGFTIMVVGRRAFVRFQLPMLHKKPRLRVTVNIIFIYLHHHIFGGLLKEFLTNSALAPSNFSSCSWSSRFLDSDSLHLKLQTSNLASAKKGLRNAVNDSNDQHHMVLNKTCSNNHKKATLNETSASYFFFSRSCGEHRASSWRLGAFILCLPLQPLDFTPPRTPSGALDASSVMLGDGRASGNDEKVPRQDINIFSTVDSSSLEMISSLLMPFK